jgi:hypothetical protein
MSFIKTVLVNPLNAESLILLCLFKKILNEEPGIGDRESVAGNWKRNQQMSIV